MIGEKRTTEALEDILTSSGADHVDKILAEYEDKMMTDDRPFTEYMRKLFRKKGISQKELFIAADLDEKFGYKLISGEKHSSQRDVILRICIAAGFSPDETQHALKLYGFSPLYVRIPRDAVIIAYIGSGKKDIWEISELLQEKGMKGIVSDKTE